MSLSYLRMHTDFSLGRGASTIQSMLKAAKANNVLCMAITDFNAMYGVKLFSDYALSSGIKPIAGINLTLKTDEYAGDVILLAMNDVGYVNLSKIHYHQWEPTIDHRGKEKVNSELFSTLDIISEYSEGVILLSGNGEKGFLAQAIVHNDMVTLEKMCSVFGDRFYVEICRSENENTKDIDKKLLDFADGNLLGNVQCRDGIERHLWPIVATTDIWYANDDRHTGYRILEAMRTSTNAVMNDDTAHPPVFRLRSEEDFNALFSDIPEAVENTFSIAVRCNYAIPSRDPILPRFGDGSRSEDDILCEMSRAGLEKRFDRIPVERHAEYRERLEFELSVIIKMKFPGYFLIVADFIQWAKSKNIPVGPGRGSGAGSLVAWALTITNVDPIPHGLFFERFLNPERVSMPDFDIDFCTDRRDEVIQYVRRKYGDDLVSMISTYGQINARKALDNTQRVVVDVQDSMYGMSDSIRIKEALPGGPAGQKVLLADAYKDEDCGLRPLLDADPHLMNMYYYAQETEGLRHHASTHAAGVIIGAKPLVEMFPMVRDPKSFIPVCAFDMKMAEKSGAVKFDFLGLKNLTIIQRTIEYIQRYTGETVDISQIPMDDAKVFQNMANGRTVGVFQFSGGGMQNVLREIHASEFSDLVAATSLYRPGPMAQIPEYARRKLTGADIHYPVEKFTKDILKETYGIIVYQEQVMQIAQACAGYSLGGADLLRRAMGKKDAKAMEEQKANFISGCQANGIPDEEADDLFENIRKFAEYGFNKSHAVAYSLISYQTMWLKVHYPACFYAALLSYDHDISKIMITQAEMRTFDVELLRPSVNHSFREFVPEEFNGKLAVRFGFCSLKNVGNKVNFVNEREDNGDYTSIYNFFERTKGMLSRADFERLVEAGCMDELVSQGNDGDRFISDDGTINRCRVTRVLEWMARASKKKKDTETLDMFSAMGEELTYDPPETYSYKDSGSLKTIDVLIAKEWEDRVWREFNALGFHVNGHPILSRIGEIAKIGARRLRSYNRFLSEKKMVSMPSKVITLLIESYEIRRSNSGKYYLSIKASDGDEFPVWLNIWTNVQSDKVKEYDFSQMPAYRDFISMMEYSKTQMKPITMYGTIFLNKNETPGRDRACDFRPEVTEAKIGRVQSLDEYISQTQAGRDLDVIIDADAPATSMELVERIIKAFLRKEDEIRPFDPEIRIVNSSGDFLYRCSSDVVKELQACANMQIVVKSPVEEAYYKQLADAVEAREIESDGDTMELDAD